MQRMQHDSFLRLCRIAVQFATSGVHKTELIGWGFHELFISISSSVTDTFVKCLKDRPERKNVKLQGNFSSVSLRYRPHRKSNMLKYGNFFEEKVLVITKQVECLIQKNFQIHHVLLFALERGRAEKGEKERSLRLTGAQLKRRGEEWDQKVRKENIEGILIRMLCRKHICLHEHYKIKFREWFSKIRIQST